MTQVSRCQQAFNLMVEKCSPASLDAALRIRAWADLVMHLQAVDRILVRMRTRCQGRLQSLESSSVGATMELYVSQHMLPGESCPCFHIHFAGLGAITFNGVVGSKQLADLNLTNPNPWGQQTPTVCTLSTV